MRSILALLLLVAGLQAQISFQAPSTIPFGSEPDGIAAADFDQDGDQDFAVALDAPDRLGIYLNSGAGSFTLGGTVLLGAGTSPQAVAAADMNGDGLMDLVVTLKNTNQLRVYANQGAATFLLLATLPCGLEPRHLAVGDLNADGFVDAVASNRDGNTLSVFMNPGNGALTAAATVPAGVEPRYVVIADLDGDGDGDLAVASHDDRSLRVLANNGTGFTAQATLFVGALVRPEGIVAGDFDGDGDLDLAATVSDQTFGLNQVVVFTNAGNASFSGPVTVTVPGAEAGDLQAADFDGDADLDLVCANKTSNDLVVLTNTAGSFGSPLVLAAGVEPERLALADFDGNGSSDILGSNKLSLDATLYLNQGGGNPGPTVSLTQLTAPAIGTTSQVLLSSSTDGGRAYQFAASFSSNTGIALPDGRVVPLDFDALFTLSTQPFNGFFVNGVGVLNAAGNSTVGLVIPNFPPLVGTSIQVAFVVFDPNAAFGVGTISPAMQVTFQ